MKACGYDETATPAATVADASGNAARGAPGVGSDAGTKPYLYETWWGFSPVVGSANQLSGGARRSRRSAAASSSPSI